MANTFSSGLYPPIVDTYMPAYLYGTEHCRIYVTLSPYTTFLDNIPVHINIVNQKTNKSVLIANDTFGLQLDAYIQQEIDSEKYYVDIDTSKYNFSPYTFYKVQFRIATKIKATNESAEVYLNKAIYSEWSTACLIKFIYAPEVTLSYFTNKIENNEGQIYGDVGTRFPDSVVFVSGKIVFPNNTGNTEYVKSYQVKFLNENDQIVEESELLSPLTNGIDEIYYMSKYNFQSNHIYQMQINFTSSGLYKWTEDYNFVVDKAQDALLNFNTQVETDEENGRFKFNISPDIEQDNPLCGKEIIIYIRRTSSKVNYNYWEDVFSQKVTLQAGYTFGWSDITIESGIWYKYVIQYSIDGKIRGDIPLSEKIINIFDNSFLTGQNGQQLKLKYDITLDSYTYHQNIQKTETIGSKYPFIRQNGAMKYRTFTISGLITYLSDIECEESGYFNNSSVKTGSVFSHINNELIETGLKKDDIGLFISKEMLYGNNDVLQEYETFFAENGINDYNNFTQERLFREAVIDFLLQSDVKLFRSVTEGNILVKLSDVSFNPKIELGRYLYSFSATATECADATIENYNLYKIQALSNLGYKLLKQEYKPVLIDTTSTSSATGISVTISDAEAGDNIKTIIEESYENMDEEYKLYQINFHSLGFSFLSEPYVINMQTLEPEIGDDIYHQVGYLIQLGDEKFFVSGQDKFKEFRGNSLYSINNISFPQQTSVNVLMDADLIYTKTNVANDSPESQIIAYINSTIVTYSMKQQVPIYSQGIFGYAEDIIEPLVTYEQANYDQDDDATFILNIYNIQITDVATGSIFQIEDDSGSYMYIVGQTGNLNINLDKNLSDNRTVINQAYFKGTIAAWADNAIISDTIITVSDSRIGNGLWYLETENKWIWHDQNANKDYDVKFFKNLNLTDEVSIVTDIILDNTKFTYVQILKPVEVTGDIIVSGKLTTSLAI